MVFQEALEGFLGFLVLGSGFLLLLLLCLNFVGIKGLLLFTQFCQSTCQERKGKSNVIYKLKKKSGGQRKSEKSAEKKEENQGKKKENWKKIKKKEKRIKESEEKLGKKKTRKIRKLREE